MSGPLPRCLVATVPRGDACRAAPAAQGLEERERSAAFIEEHGLALFCRAIYNTNEFLYLE